MIRLQSTAEDVEHNFQKPFLFYLSVHFTFKKMTEECFNKTWTSLYYYLHRLIASIIAKSQ